VKGADPFSLLWPPPRRLRFATGNWIPGPDPPAARLVGDGSLPAGGYRLRAGPEPVRIEAADEAGARHAAATLEQIVRFHRDEPSIPAFAIEDWPDFRHRGVMLDVSRGKVPTLKTLRALIDRLASFKFDELQLYTEHAFAYAGHEGVWRDASAYTPDEIRDLDAHCRRRGIELVPNQQSLGHMHRWLVHDRYRGLAEVPDGVEHAWSLEREPFSLCPTDPASLGFLSGLYDQLLTCFSSRRMNVGLDEAFDIGTGRSRGECESRGHGRVYVDFLRSVHGLVRARGRTMQCWADGILRHRELAGEIPRDVTPLLWGYEADHPFAEESGFLATTGLDFYVCPGTSSWQSVAGRTANARANLESAALHGVRSRASGYLVADWGDRGHLQPGFASWPGFLLGAGFAWNASVAASRELDLAGLLDAHVFGDPSRGLGRIALDLGNLYLATGSRSTNGSALFFLLAFAAGPLPHARLPGLTIGGLERSFEGLRAIRGRLGSVEGADRLLVADEMRWAADVLAFACGFGVARLRAPEGAPVQAIPAKERRRLAAELVPLAAEHRRLWLERNRPGGLDESAGWLERVLALLA